jgi:replicative DNA helicase
MSEPDAYHKELGEQLLGNLLNDNGGLLEIFEIIRPGDFYNEEQARGFQVFCELYEKGIDGRTIDLGMLAKYAKTPAHRLVEWMDAGFVSANIQWRAKEIKKLSQQRELERRFRHLQGLIYELEPAEFANRLSEVASEIVLDGDRKRVYSSPELVNIFEQTQQERVTNSGRPRGIKTGLHYLDKVLTGLFSKCLTLIAAATGFGKTTLTLNVAYNIAMQGFKILFISNENDVAINLDRFCGIASNRRLKDIGAGYDSANVVNDFRKAFDSKNLFLSDNSPRDINEICGLIRKYSIQYGVEVVVLDHIGEIALVDSGEANRHESEEQRLARWTGQLLQTARAQGVHLILVAQLNRQGNTGGRPTKTELSGCFRMAQKAHSMLLFWQDTNGQDVLTVEKNRTGQAGVNIAVTFDRSTQRIWDTGLYDLKSKQVVSRQTAKPDGKAAAAGDVPGSEAEATAHDEPLPF